jgi:hypothetical protein
VIVNGGGAIVIVRVAVATCEGDDESVTLKVSGVALTATEGVPLIAPVEAFRVNPVGSVPAVSCQKKGAMPPPVWRICEYAVPATPLASEVVVMVRTGGATVSVKLALADWAGEPESVTLNVREAAAVCVVGVPLITPLEAFKDSPAGIVPAVNCHV